MNILIPHTWLQDHLETSATPEEIQKQLSLCGPSVERIHQLEGEPVYDIEVTTNRVDSMSVRGIAREAAVILEQFGLKANLKPIQLNEVKVDGQVDKLPLPKIINDPKLCKRVLAVVLRDVKRAATPDWMGKRLLQTEQNIHDAIIDITNYITHELGHPCHAFDYDKVMALGGTIIVKEAAAGKPFTTLDGVTYKTVGGEVVFENEAGEIIDLPAIKGTANTSIDESTKNVLFWVESLDAKKVRFASMTHAIRTVAAQLNEKKVDPELGLDVLKRGVQLYQEICGAVVASELYDEYPGKPQPQTITVKAETIAQYLGVNLDSQRVEAILTDLGCQVSWNDTHTELTVTPPTFRPDLEIPADIVEEIARIYGYHNLPSVLMPTAIPMTKPSGVNFAVENKIKRFLSTLGWQEVYTYSMVSAEIAQQSGYSLEEHLKIQNALTDDRVYLRRSLTPSLEEVIAENPELKTLSVFEIAHLYHPQPQALLDQVLHLTLVSSGEYRVVRGALEALADHLFIKGLTIAQADLASAQGTVTALAGTQSVTLGTVEVLNNGHTVIDLLISEILKVVQSHPEYAPLPKTAIIREDLTFTVPETQQIGQIINDVKLISPLIREVTLSAVYKRNFTFAVAYHDPTHNITAEHVEPVRKAIVQLIQQKHQAQLVGSV